LICHQSNRGHRVKSAGPEKNGLERTKGRRREVSRQDLWSAPRRACRARFRYSEYRDEAEKFGAQGARGGKYQRKYELNAHGVLAANLKAVDTLLRASIPGYESE